GPDFLSQEGYFAEYVCSPDQTQKNHHDAGQSQGTQTISGASGDQDARKQYARPTGYFRLPAGQGSRERNVWSDSGGYWRQTGWVPADHPNGISERRRSPNGDDRICGFQRNIQSQRWEYSGPKEDSKKPSFSWRKWPESGRRSSGRHRSLILRGGRIIILKSRFLPA